MKKLGKVLKFFAFAGIVAAGVSYFNQYVRFNKKVEEEFHELEDKQNENIFVEDETVPLKTGSEVNGNKKELANAAKKLANAGIDVLHAGSAVLKDTYQNLKENPKVSSLLDKATEVVSGKKAVIENDTPADIEEAVNDVSVSVQEDIEKEE